MEIYIDYLKKTLEKEREVKREKEKILIDCNTLLKFINLDCCNLDDNNFYCYIIKFNNLLGNIVEITTTNNIIDLSEKRAKFLNNAKILMIEYYSLEKLEYLYVFCDSLFSDKYFIKLILNIREEKRGTKNVKN